jgi:hypothetical protein
MIQKLTNLPRSSNKSMWRFLLRKHFVNFGINFYTVPEFALTLLFSKRAVQANYPGYTDTTENQNTAYSTVISNNTRLSLCTALQITGSQTTASTRFSQFPLAYSSNFDVTGGVAALTPTRGISFVNGSYLLGHTASLLSINSIKFFYKQWIYEVGRVLYFFLFIKIKYKGKSYK